MNNNINRRQKYKSQLIENYTIMIYLYKHLCKICYFTATFVHKVN